MCFILNPRVLLTRNRFNDKEKLGWVGLQEICHLLLPQYSNRDMRQFALFKQNQ